MITLFLILIGIIILLCIWLNNVSARIGIPTLLAFIVLGMIFSNNGLVPLHFEDHVFAKETCTVALIFIMFYGGFGTRWDSAKPVVREATLLASLGVILTAGLTGLFCHFALRWGWGDSMVCFRFSYAPQKSLDSSGFFFLFCLPHLVRDDIGEYH